MRFILIAAIVVVLIAAAVAVGWLKFYSTDAGGGVTVDAEKARADTGNVLQSTGEAMEDLGERANAPAEPASP